MPEWHIESADRLRHRSGRGNIRRGRALVERESRPHRCSPERSIGCSSTDNWSSCCYNRKDSSCIRRGIRHKSNSRNRGNPSNNRRNMGSRHNILRRTEHLFRRSKKRCYPANRVDEYLQRPPGRFAFGQPGVWQTPALLRTVRQWL
jgi:hypothetical protein